MYDRPRGLGSFYFLNMLLVPMFKLILAHTSGWRESDIKMRLHEAIRCTGHDEKGVCWPQAHSASLLNGYKWPVTPLRTNTPLGDLTLDPRVQVRESCALLASDSPGEQERYSRS